MKNTLFRFNAKNRLDYYRKQAADCAAKNPTYTAAANWKYWRHNIWSTANNARGKDGQIFTDSVDQIGVFIGEYWTLNRRIDNCGWFSDNWQSETIKGGVCKLRTARGVYYVPVTWSTDWDGVIHYLNDCEKVDKGGTEADHENAVLEAARSANHYAERAAEEAREYDAKNSAENDINEARDSIHSINKTALQLISEIKKHGDFSPAICSALRDRLTDFMRKRAAAFALIETRTADYWTAVN